MSDVPIGSLIAEDRATRTMRASSIALDMRRVGIRRAAQSLLAPHLAQGIEVSQTGKQCSINPPTKEVINHVKRP